MEIKEQVNELVKLLNNVKDATDIISLGLSKISNEIKINEINDEDNLVFALKYSEFDPGVIETWNYILELPEPILLNFYRYLYTERNDMDTTLYKDNYIQEHSESAYKAITSIMWNFKYMIEQRLFSNTVSPYYSASSVFARYSKLNYVNKEIIKGQFKKLEEIIKLYRM